MKLKIISLYVMLILFFVISNLFYNLIGSLFTIEMFYLYAFGFLIYFTLLLIWAFFALKTCRSYSSIIIVAAGLVINILNFNLRESYENYSNLLWSYTDEMLRKQNHDLKIITQKNIYNIHDLIVRIPPIYGVNIELNSHIIKEKLDAYAGCEIKTKKLRAEYYAAKFSC